MERVPPCVDQCLKGGVHLADKNVDAILGYLQPPDETTHGAGAALR